jgi:hypothetical protein
VKTLFLKYHIEILAVLAALLFFATREPTSPYDKMIGSDGKGYYAYLPAIFIHGDFAYDFVESYERIHYGATDNFFDFRIKTDTGTVNKYFPGVAILWLPFFLLAHIFSLLFGFSADGYSLPYQIAIGLAAVFYLWLGLKFLRKLLENYKITGWVGFFVVWILFFGTNLYYYTIEEPAFTHVYSFALINIFSLTAIKLSKKYQPIGLYILAISLALIIIIRPVNGIVIFAVPFLSGTNKNFFRFFQNIFRDTRNLIGASLVGLAIALIIPLLWVFQNGNFIIYTYGDETFNFLSSHFIDVLFSYHNGWLVYSPIVIVSFAGFYPVFKRSKPACYKLLAFLLIAVYVVGSWSVWWYGEAFGMRPMIEFYFVVAILLGQWLQFIRLKKIILLLTILILLMLTFFSLFQTWQFKNGILPAKHLNCNTYWNNFLSTTPKAKVYFDEHRFELVQSFNTDLETDPGWLNYASASDEMAFSGILSSKIDSSNVYSIGFRKDISGYLVDEGSLVIVSAMVFSVNKTSSARLIIDFPDHSETSVGYHTFFLREFVTKNNWTQVEFTATIPAGLTKSGILAVYFWNPASDEILFVDDIRIEVWKVKPSGN